MPGKVRRYITLLYYIILRGQAPSVSKACPAPCKSRGGNNASGHKISVAMATLKQMTKTIKVDQLMKGES